MVHIARRRLARHRRSMCTFHLTRCLRAWSNARVEKRLRRETTKRARAKKRALVRAMCTLQLQLLRHKSSRARVHSGVLLLVSSHNNSIAYCSCWKGRYFVLTTPNSATFARENSEFCRRFFEFSHKSQQQVNCEIQFYVDLDILKCARRCLARRLWRGMGLEEWKGRRLLISVIASNKCAVSNFN